MSDTFFFGYGSLVNRATHAYPQAHPARLQGWARAWRHLPGRSVAVLTAVPDPGAEIAGLIAAVPGGDWAALDAREASYDRVALNGGLWHSAQAAGPVAIYAVPDAALAPPGTRHPILLSYLDVVVQGFATEFGAQGVAEFFATTHGWEAPVLDDRAQPRYARHQRLDAAETALVDAGLARLGVRVIGG